MATVIIKLANARRGRPTKTRSGVEAGIRNCNTGVKSELVGQKEKVVSLSLDPPGPEDFAFAWVCPQHRSRHSHPLCVTSGLAGVGVGVGLGIERRRESGVGMGGGR